MPPDIGGMLLSWNRSKTGLVFVFFFHVENDDRKPYVFFRLMDEGKYKEQQFMKGGAFCNVKCILFKKIHFKHLIFFLTRLAFYKSKK